MRIFFYTIILVVSLFSNDKKFEIGERIYLQTCVSCHGVNGQIDENIKLIVKPRSLSKTILNEEQTYYIIKDGAKFWGAKSSIMPSFKSIYSDEKIRSISHYISKKFNPNVDNKIKKMYEDSDDIPEDKKYKMLKRGAKIYKRNCSWCHGINGDGNGEASRNPELSIFPYNLRKTLLSNEQMFLYIKFGGKHWGAYKDDMPSWSRKYDDYTIKSVVKYIDENFRK